MCSPLSIVELLERELRVVELSQADDQVRQRALLHVHVLTVVVEPNGHLREEKVPGGAQIQADRCLINTFNNTAARHENS